MATDFAERDKWQQRERELVLSRIVTKLVAHVAGLELDGHSTVTAGTHNHPANTAAAGSE